MGIKRKVIIHDIFTRMSIECESMRDACKWFYDNKYAKTKDSALGNVQRSIKTQNVIYKKFYLTEKE